MHGEGYRLINCEICGKAFRTNRSHTTTCSPACKQKKYRMNKKNKAGQGRREAENVTGVTLSYLDWLVSTQLSFNSPEDWQND